MSVIRDFVCLEYHRAIKNRLNAFEQIFLVHVP
jgi:hypothetical protein